jgi:hypothetical protein
MTTTTHYMKSEAESTACGLRDAEQRRTTVKRKDVTCRRCLITMLPYPLTDQELRDAEDEPAWITTFKTAVETLTVMMTQKTTSIQDRMTKVVQTIAQANKDGDGLMLDYRDVEALSMLLYLLGQK